jgi:hypothetical protein
LITLSAAFLVPPLALAAGKSKTRSACERAYEKAITSKSIVVIKRAAQLCDQATAKACALQAYGPEGEYTGDGRWLSASCGLSHKLGRNKAVNNGVATKTCAEASEQGFNSPSIGDLAEASALCEESTDRSISEFIQRRQDGLDTSLTEAVLSLEAAHGGYQEVMKN